MPASLRSKGQPNRAAANVRSAIPGCRVRPDPAVRRGGLRDLSMGRRRARSKQAVPQGHFAAAAAGNGPDYASCVPAGSRGPACADDPSHWLPEGAASRHGSGQAAIFYIHPDDLSGARSLERAARRRRRDRVPHRSFVQSQASAFNGAGRIWAPRYRQAAFGAFLLKSEDAQKALDLAYGDVAAAFDEFVKEARRPADHPRRPQPGRAAPAAAAARKDRRQADREAHRRGLCRRLADQHHRRPSRARPSRLRSRRTRPAASCRG